MLGMYRKGCRIFLTSSSNTFIIFLQSGLDIGPLARNTLDSFCHWQSNLKDEVHHDHAVLMTRLDLCIDKNECDTIGKRPL